MRVTHTPLSAARAVRSLMSPNIARTWADYQRHTAHEGHWLNAYDAAKLVQEQVNGIDRAKGGVADGPCSFREASEAVAEVIPELFAEYWSGLA